MICSQRLYRLAAAMVQSRRHDFANGHAPNLRAEERLMATRTSCTRDWRRWDESSLIQVVALSSLKG